MFTLATVTRPLYSAAISSSAGAIILHGPHHSAQKSTRTGSFASSTWLLKLASSTATVFSLTWSSQSQTYEAGGRGGESGQAPGVCASSRGGGRVVTAGPVVHTSAQR